MASYKVLLNVAFDFDHDGALDEATLFARDLVDGLIDVSPTGSCYRRFSSQVEIVPIKERSSPEVMGEFTLRQVFAWIDKGLEFKVVAVGSEEFHVSLKSDRYVLFRRGTTCVACGLAGNKFRLETSNGGDSCHLNLYGTEDGRDVLMTKDHIRAKAYGGRDEQENYAVLCEPCNQAKGSFPIGYEGVAKLREMLRNPDHLTANALKRRVANARLNMLDCLNGQ